MRQVAGNLHEVGHDLHERSSSGGDTKGGGGQLAEDAAAAGAAAGPGQQHLTFLYPSKPSLMNW